MASHRIESLIEKGEWQAAQVAIEKRLVSERDNHWLWARLSAAKYEQRDYPGALAAAETALEIVPDCPLALWDYAGALDALGRTKDAGKVYAGLLLRGLEELRNPDADAEECWEGSDWTRGLVMDCIFRIAGGLASIGGHEEAIDWYKRFLTLLDYGAQQGIYSRADAMARLKRLDPSKKAIPNTVKGEMQELKKAMDRVNSDSTAPTS